MQKVVLLICLLQVPQGIIDFIKTSEKTRVFFAGWYGWNYQFINYDFL